ncbi:gustatory receptor for sugar taste 64f-like [Aphomia sociella]
MTIECAAIWKATKALAGWSSDTVGHRSVTARLAGTLFYTTSIMALILSTRLSFAWKRLSALWTSVERATPVNVPPDTSLRRRLKLVVEDYSIWVSIPVLFISKIATIIWNYQDGLIILISMGLTSRYHRLNKYVATVCAMEITKINGNQADALNVYTWRKIREAYVKQAMLVRKVNSAVGLMILISSFGNFYSIVSQLFLGIT